MSMGLPSKINKFEKPFLITKGMIYNCSIKKWIKSSKNDVIMDKRDRKQKQMKF